MAHYVISDIHGESDRFHEMLRIIDFNDLDTLYILGDVVDRGPDGIVLLQEIMKTPNWVMLLGNHEYMMLQYFHPDATDVDVRRWNKNGNAPTLEQFLSIEQTAREEILEFLKKLPTHLELELESESNSTSGADTGTKTNAESPPKPHSRKFYLVHGFPGENVHDDVWNRPTLATPNPRSGCRLIVGHTPITSLVVPREERADYIADLERRGEHLRIYHALGFTDIDCGCGHSMSVKKLACLRLEDMAEFYV